MWHMTPPLLFVHVCKRLVNLVFGKLVLRKPIMRMYYLINNNYHSHCKSSFAGKNGFLVKLFQFLKPVSFSFAVALHAFFKYKNV